MIKSKLLKAIILGVCISALSSGVAFASETKVGRTEPSSMSQTTQISNEMLELQAKVDSILYKEYADELSKKGITVNYSSITNDTVEIGVYPYTQENADYVNGIIAEDKVKIVEGLNPEIYTTMEVDPEAAALSADGAMVNEEKVYKSSDNKEVQLVASGVDDMSTTTAKLNNEKSSKENMSSMVLMIVVMSGVVLLSAVVLMMMRQRRIKR